MAPSAFRIPISRVRSVTDTSMMFMMPMPPTIREMAAMPPRSTARMDVMLTQIQPHFMYNALTSIAMMCVNDPKKAQEATVTFAKYLRGNMDSLKQKEPVPFS